MNVCPCHYVVVGTTYVRRNYFYPSYQCVPNYCFHARPLVKGFLGIVNKVAVNKQGCIHYPIVVKRLEFTCIRGFKKTHHGPTDGPTDGWTNERMEKAS